MMKLLIFLRPIIKNVWIKKLSIILCFIGLNENMIRFQDNDNDNNNDNANAAYSLKARIVN